MQNMLLCCRSEAFVSNEGDQRVQETNILSQDPVVAAKQARRRVLCVCVFEGRVRRSFD